MAVKSSNQITITDITDAYSVMLTSEAYTFIGNTTGAPAGLSCTTNVVAFCGSNQCQSVTVGDITAPSGISVTKSNNGTSNVTITLTTTAQITNAGEITIPVTVDGVTINKKFSYAVAKQGGTGGPGPKGDPGVDAIAISITASPGTIIKNSSGQVTLTAHVFKGGVEQTINSSTGVVSGLGTVKWYKGSSTTGVAGKTCTVSASDVSNILGVTCQLEG